VRRHEVPLSVGGAEPEPPHPATASNAIETANMAHTAVMRSLMTIPL
jgi:hypothetical protein